MSGRVVRRMAAAAALLIVAALAAGLGVELYGRHRLKRELPAFARAVGPVDLAAHRRPPLAEPDNAASYLLAAARSLIFTADDKQAVNRVLDVSVAAGDWPEADRAAVEAVLARNAASLALAARATALERADYQQARAFVQGDLLPLLNVGRLAYAAGRLHLADGDHVALVQDTAVLGRLATTLEDERFLLALLIGVAAEKFQLACIREAIVEGAPAATLDELAARIPRGDLVAQMRAAQASEVAATLADIDGTLPDDHFLAPFPDQAADLPRPLRSITRRLGAAGAMALIRDLARASGGAQAALEESVTTAAWPVPDRHRLRANLIAIDGRIHGMIRLRDLARVALDLRRQRLRDGAYPDRLEPRPDTAGGPHMELVREDDGRARLELTGAAGHWPQIAAHEPSRTLLRWPLP